MSVDHDFLTTFVHALVSPEDSVMDTGTMDSVQNHFEFIYSAFSPFDGHFSDRASTF